MQERIKPREVEPVWHALLMRVASSKNEDVMVGLDGALTIKVDCMERFAQAVARECAEICRELANTDAHDYNEVRSDCAQAIRARFGLGE